MSLVPHGCTLRTRFDRDTESFLRQLSLQIQSNVSQFVAQENADVGLREKKPFHITILEISPLLSVSYVMSTVNTIAYKTSRLVGKVLPFCQVCENGEVRVKVNCPDITLLGHELCLSLPGSNGWYSQSNDSLFITIGIFHGIHRFDFETWLNKELSTNNDLFPTFYSDYVCYSDEWRYVAHAHEQAVALRGRVLTNSAGNNGSMLPDKTLDMEGIEGDMAGLLESFNLAGDEGTMSNVEHEENKSSITQSLPDETETGTLPNPPNESTENVPYQATVAPAGGSVWGSVTNGKIAPPTAILAMREGGRVPTSGTTKPVSSTAVKRSGPASAVSASVVKTAPIKSKVVADKPKEDSVAKAPTEEATTHGGSSSSVSGPNWVCPNCKLVVYGRRAQCFKCKTAKPATNQVNGTAAPAVMTGTSPRAASGGASGSGGTHLYPRKPKDGDVRDGDWICTGCKGHNFASKIACFTCRTPRPPGYVIDVPDVASGEAAKADRKPGDWTCPKCNENVFAKRNRCYKCSTSKPKNLSNAHED